MYDCPWIFSSTVHLIDFTLGSCIAEDPKECSVECEADRMSGSRECCKPPYWVPSNRPVPNSDALPMGTALANTKASMVKCSQ